MIEKRMKTANNTAAVSLLPVQEAGWGAKIGAERAGFIEKQRFGTAKWLDMPCGTRRITNTNNKYSFKP